MKRARATLLTICILSPFSFMLYSCDEPGGETGGGSNSQDEQIFIPDISGTGREPVNISELQYTRPDTDNLIEAIRRASDIISKSELEYSRQLEAIRTIEPLYSHYSTMYAYLTLMTSKNSADREWTSEYAALSEAEPDIADALEELYVEAARSEYANSFEEDYFGEGHIEKYSDGGRHTDEAVAYLKREAALTSEYTSLSTATVVINYKGESKTYDEIAKELADKYGEWSVRYSVAIKECDALYERARSKRAAELFCELVKVRADIADAMGYEDYREYAYELRGHDYSPEELDALVEEISQYTVPVYQALEAAAFGGYFRHNKGIRVTRESVINGLYKAYTDMDKDIADAYAFMLASGLYDVEPKAQNRKDGAFTLYLTELDAPFVFTTLTSNVTDYSTLSHEFGHFYELLSRGTSSPSLDLSEVSSQSLELLTLTRLDGIMNADEYKYVYYSSMRSALLTLITQGFYAKLESLIYGLEGDEVTEENLNSLVREAAKEMHLNPSAYTTISSVLIDHLVLYPFYVQSYCTSLAVSLDIFFLECENVGEGVRIYSALSTRDEDGEFCDVIDECGLDLPFNNNMLKGLLDKIYYSIIGSYYFTGPGDINNVA